MIEVRTELTGGGYAIIVDGWPRELYTPNAKTRRSEEKILLERAENQYRCWLDWEGPWAVVTNPLAVQDPGAHRMVRPSKQQPTHIVKFVPDICTDIGPDQVPVPPVQPPEQIWMLLVDTVSPGAAYAWTHAEWLDDSDAYEEGGLWCQIEGAWHYRVPAPNNMTGTVTVEEMKR